MLDFLKSFNRKGGESEHKMSHHEMLAAHERRKQRELQMMRTQERYFNRHPGL